MKSFRLKSRFAKKIHLVIYGLLPLLGFPQILRASVFMPGFKWNTDLIRVCWASREHAAKSMMNLPGDIKKYPVDTIEPIPPDQREIIRSVIDNEYTPGRVGIAFTGWKDCDDALAQTDIAIFGVQSDVAPAGRANVGKPVSPRNPEDLAGYIAFNFKDIAFQHGKLSESEYLKIVALHEFGHALGFRHEYGRDEWNSDPNCKIIKEESRSRILQNASFVFFDYDQNSIMSYCYIKALMFSSGSVFEAPTRQGEPLLALKDESLLASTEGEPGKFHVSVRIGLSTTDVLSLKCLYGPIQCTGYGLDHLGRRIDQTLIRCAQVTKRREKKDCAEQGYVDGFYRAPK